VSFFKFYPTTLTSSVIKNTEPVSRLQRSKAICMGVVLTPGSKLYLVALVRNFLISLASLAVGVV
jgi:hypothetical protein